MKNKSKRILLVVTMLILMCVPALNIMAAENDTTVTRAEWIHKLVSAFDLKAEDGLIPDDYYSDIAASEYYNDILQAIDSGVIDLEEGEKFQPDAPVTREFAAQTLNNCLGYELDKETEYTMSDYVDLQYPQAAQIAINNDWLDLVNDAFEPDKNITAAEENNMLNIAKKVLEASVIEKDHKNVYKFADNIIEIPEETPIELLSNTEIMIYDTSLKLSEGDSIAVYSNGIAYTYKIVKLEEKAEGVLVTGEEISYEDAVVSVDAEGIIDADLSNFVPAEGVTVDVEYEEEVSAYGLPKVQGAKKIVKIDFEEKIGGGTVSCSLSNLKVHYQIDNKGYKLIATGHNVVSCTVSGNKEFILTLGTIGVTGVGEIRIDMIYSANGSATLKYGYDFETGIEKEEGAPVRKFKTHSLGQWHFSAKAELKASCRVGFYVNIPSVASGYIYGETGVKSNPVVEVYGDGRKPTVCMDLPVYIFATVEYNVTVLHKKVAGDTIPIWDKKNSPCRICYHIEDGKEVNYCSRPDSSSSVGKRGYYTTSTSGSGTYSGNCFVAPSVAEPVFEYELDENNNATITKYIGSVYCLTIPEELDGYPVVAIGNGAFKENAYLGSVVIPDGVTSIENNAFKECTILNDVVLPSKLEMIGIGAFQECVSLAKINIPPKMKTKGLMGVTTGYPGVFYGCSSLNSVEFEKGITTIPEGLFYGCTGLTKIEIPDTVTKIELRAFRACSNLENVKLPASLTSLGNYVFEDCVKIREIELPQSLLEIGLGAYGNCTLLQKVNIPSNMKTAELMGVTTGYPGAFYGCSTLKEVQFEKGITTIPEGLFYGCTGITKIEIPNTVTKIELRAFHACSNLESVNLSTSLTELGSYAFKDCVKIREIELPQSLLEIGYGVFENCTSLQKTNVPANMKTASLMGVTNGYPGVFYDCSTLNEVEFEEGITTIPEGLFYGCTGLQEVKIPDNITTIESRAFKKCTELKEIAIPDTVNDMGEYVFAWCVNLKKVQLQKEKVNIQKGTFQDCTSLMEINFPETLETIGVDAFKNCTSLLEVNISKNVYTICSGAFEGCTSLTKVTIPESMRNINNNAFSHCESLTDLSISEGVTSIGANAFEYCTALEKVTLPDTLQSLGNYAFSYCNKLSEVNIGAGLSVIPDYCFMENPALAKVILPQQVTTIKPYAFANCTGLGNVTINRNVTTIDNTAFSYPEKLTIHGITGTYAEAFAKENEITFSALNSPATAIKLNATQIEIGKKETIQMTAAITPADSSDELVWSSTDDTIASISETGKLTANAIGSTTILAMAGNVVETCEVKVYEPVTSVYIDKSSYTGAIGETIQLTATVHPKSATYQKITWSSSNNDVAEVNEKGLVSLKKYGTATITATTEKKEKTAICEITVKPIGVTGITLDAKEKILGIGAKYQLIANISPENASIKDVIWTSSKAEVATVENGLVTGISEGTAIIIVKTKDGSKTATCTVTVRSTIEDPIQEPTATPKSTNAPSNQATEEPKETLVPTVQPTITQAPTATKTEQPIITQAPTAIPTKKPITFQEPTTTKVTKPAKVKIKSVKSTGKKKIKVTWRWDYTADGYQVQYALNKKFTKGKKTKNVGAYSEAKTLTKLKSKKYYYVRVRAYKKANGKKVYGKWSTVKKCKVK